MNLIEATQRLVGKSVLVASDFDGTLAELVDHHDDVEVNPRALEALSDLALLPDVSVAVVSGRSREDLLRFVGSPEGLRVIGEHGGDTGAGEAAEQGSVAELSRRIQDVADANPGTHVETKRMSVVFHYRTAEGDVSRAIDQVRAAAGPDMAVSDGKKVVEVHTSRTTKGDAVASLRVETGSETVVFLGDDQTDETVFSALQPQDIGIKVGEGESAARFRVESVSAVAEFLRDLAKTLA